MMWVVFGWIVFCWIIGAASRALIGLGLFLAPIMGVITYAISDSTKAGWLAAAVTLFLPVGFYQDKQERDEAAKRAEWEAETAKRKKDQERRQIETDVVEAYEVLKELPENEEAKQMCQDYIEHYCNDVMNSEIKHAFEKKIIDFARPYVEARELKEEQEEELRWREEERQEQLRLYEKETKNAVLRKRYIDNT